jgi:hypothetical protein
MLAVVIGTTQDFSGLTGDLPQWLPPAVLVAFVPFITGLVVMVSAPIAACGRNQSVAPTPVGSQ